MQVLVYIKYRNFLFFGARGQFGLWPQLAAAMLCRSQVCSALRKKSYAFLLGLAFGHGCAALGHSAP